MHVQPGLSGSLWHRVRPGRPPAGQCGGGGGGVSLPQSAPPRLPWAGTEAGRFVRALLGAAVPLRSTAPGQSRQSAARNAGVSGRSTLGARHTAALAAAAASDHWVPRPSRGGAGPLPLRPASCRPRAGRGGEGGVGGVGGRGGFPSVPPWSSGVVVPRRPRGGGLVVPVPGGQPPTRGAHSSPVPLRPSGARPSCRPSLGPSALLAVAARYRLAGGGGEGPASAGGGCSGQRSAVSGLRGSGPPLALVAPVLSPTGGGARPSAAPYGGGDVGRGARLRWGGLLVAHPPPTPSRSSPGPAGRGCHLRRRLCGGWGCGGGGFRRW